MKLARKFAFVLLLTGLVVYLPGMVEAEDNPCQQACSNTKQACVQDAAFAYDDCRTNAEFSLYTCLGNADDKYDQCLEDCYVRPHAGCVGACDTEYLNGQAACNVDWSIAEQICFNIEQTALNSCETAYNACYNSCPP